MVVANPAIERQTMFPALPILGTSFAKRAVRSKKAAGPRDTGQKTAVVPNLDNP
jgi:hypothetical protein